MRKDSFSRRTFVCLAAAAALSPAMTLADTAETEIHGRTVPAATTSLPIASCDAGENLTGARSYRVEMPSNLDGEAIVFEVFEPNVPMDCAQGSPLILQGHGFSDGRKTEADTPQMQRLLDAGYTIISIDQRGHGEAGGTVRIMDPDFAGPDNIQIVDWAEANLDYLPKEEDNLVLGTIGHSYGGAFQYLLYNTDPQKRVDAMVPEITWHDLENSLAPNGVAKSYWEAFMVLTGELETGFRFDPIVRSTLLDNILTNKLPEDADKFLHYHSNTYFCDNEKGLQVGDASDTSGYTYDPLYQLLPLTAGGESVVMTERRPQHPVDVLMFQSTKDTLFPFNEAYENLKCLEKTGGDVRLLTYSYGHHAYQVSPSSMQAALDNGSVITENLDDIGLSSQYFLRRCGDIKQEDATVAWFDEKLRGLGDADSVITSGDGVCFALDYEGDSVVVDDVTVGGKSFDIDGFLGAPVIATAGPELLPEVVKLGTVSEDAILAGIPTATIDLSAAGPIMNAYCSSGDNAESKSACDAILFLGIGVKSGLLSAPVLVDNQVVPLRKFGEHTVEFPGLAKRLNEGDELYLMIYGSKETYLASFSRDLTSYLVEVDGTVNLPLLTSDGSAQLQ